MRQVEYEPKKWISALQAGFLFFGFFVVVFASADLNWDSPQPVAVRITLIPDLSRPAVEPPPPPPPEPAPAAKEEPPEDLKRLAEIARENQEEKKKDDERKRKAAEEKKKDDERKRKAAEEKKKDDERKRKAAEEKKKDDERKRKAAEEKKKDDERKRKAAEEKKKDDERKRKAAKDAATQTALLANRLNRIKGRIIGIINTRINHNLKPPKNIPKKNLNGSDVVVVVRVLSDKEGNLKKGFPIVEQSSGFPDYDKEALRAVRAMLRTAPLPIPDDPFIVNNPSLLKDFTDFELRISPN